MTDKKDWRSEWRKDKSSAKYKRYLQRRNASMKKTARERLEKLNKKMPKQYESRNKTKK